MTNKRANGEGTITKRSDGRWEARVTIALDGAGRPQRKAVYGRTRADAREKMTTILRSLQSGGLVNLDERLTTGAYLQRWLEESVRQRVRPRTFELYELIVRLHIAPIVGRVQLTKLSPMHAQRMLNKLSPTLAP